jgi:hypothetical protein
MRPLLNGGTLDSPMTRDVMPVAAEFLERLIHDSEPIHAISTLSNIWSVRANADLPCFGLSRPEYVVQLCLIYSGEVGNGGHSQYFLNRGGRLIRDTLDALHAVGLPELEATLASAAAQFPNGNIPTDPEETERAFEQLAEESLAELAQLDTHAFRFLPVVDPHLLTYVRTHKTQILLPEAPLNRRVGQGTS